jgi:7-carboxy-7-deazaguanine synthase
MKKIQISNIYHSIQGEGATQGTSSVFINLKNCNLECGGEGTIKDKKLHNEALWRCDSIDIWSNGKSIEIKNFINKLDKNKFIHKLKLGSHLVFTGGEPLLQQEAIMDFIKQIKFLYGFKPFIEIETNGTLMPSKSLLNNVELFNCSPKLSNSGVSISKRMKPNIIKKYISTGNKAIFKFIISRQEDWEEIKTEWIEVMNIPKRLIYLMPSAENIKELIKNQELTIKMVLENNVNYSNRIQLQIFNLQNIEKI